MMKRSYLLPLVVALCSAGALATELVQWKRLPVPVTLHTGHERVIFVNRNVRVGYPAALDGKLRIQSSGGTVYLKASEPFAQTRLQLADLESGELILLDIRATEGEELEPLELRYGETVYRNDKAVAPSASGDPATKSAISQLVVPDLPVPVQLTRYAAQRLYAPARTVEAVGDIMPVALRLPTRVTTLLPGEPVTATPLAAWRKGEMTVTALRLKNRSMARVELDPRALQGNFLTATFQHGWLGATGTPDDTTVVYLVTEGRVARAVLPEPVAVKVRKGKGGK